MVPVALRMTEPKMTLCQRSQSTCCDNAEEDVEFVSLFDAVFGEKIDTDELMLLEYVWHYDTVERM